MARWPKTKIVFVTYPTAFESRTTYLQQSYAIDEAIQLLVRDFSGIKIINIPDEAIYCDERTDNFPYHFGISAKAYVARELESWVETLI